MNYPPCQDRRFSLKLRDAYVEVFDAYLHWYRHLLERLGVEATHELWSRAQTDIDRGDLDRILSEGWSEITPEETRDTGALQKPGLAKLFSEPVQGVTGRQAADRIQAAYPLSRMAEAYPALAVERQISTYDALHLSQDGLARLAEALLDRYGEAGRLLAYDILLAEVALADFKPVTVKEFIQQREARFREPPAVATMHSAGLDVELIKVSDNEIVNHVKACEWARYYRERHPRVGYLMACSRDDAAYRAMNPNLRLERRSTIMEGGELCDFRIFATSRLKPD
jgi:hypothetical protein